MQPACAVFVAPMNVFIVILIGYCTTAAAVPNQFGRSVVLLYITYNMKHVHRVSFYRHAFLQYLEYFIQFMDYMICLYLERLW